MISIQACSNWHLINLSKITPCVSDAMTWLSPRVGGLSGTAMVALRDPAAGDGSGFAGYYATLDYQLVALARRQ
ncbi:hypothetical protein [Burkholderia sp. L27(2015)]|uniref:hypothetical protein n=1 Tax=Burkholderia sp. L27(2015) TaxID=1641858 RepID=UPI00131D805A|nr:hypothetical protein [Burkholderia sp. L27(2015)]